MKRAVIVVALIGAAFVAWRIDDRSYAPVRKYKAFAEEIVHRRYDAAAALTEGLTPADLAKAGSQEKVGAGPAMFQTLFPSRFDVESLQSDPGGTVTLVAVQTVLFNPPGVESAVRPAMSAMLKQTVRLRKSQGVWKVVSFDNTLR